jgi:hypothetical protein
MAFTRLSPDVLSLVVCFVTFGVEAAIVESTWTLRGRLGVRGILLGGSADLVRFGKLAFILLAEPWDE